MAFVKEILTKTGKKMYLTEVNGKTYASFTMQVIDDFLAGKEVSTKPGNGNWVFINALNQPSASQPAVVQSVQQTPVVSSPTKVVTNGSTAILKTKLQQVISELNELVTSLD